MGWTNLYLLKPTPHDGYIYSSLDTLFQVSFIKKGLHSDQTDTNPNPE